MLSKWFLLFFCLLAACCCRAQQTLAGAQVIYTTDVEGLPDDSVHQFTVRHIVVHGNGKTKRGVVLRELDVQEGSTLSLSILAEQMLVARNALMRSNLFRTASLSLVRVAPQVVDVMVQVEERWYLFPMPFVKPVDYSFMEWMADDNRSLRRINYGLRLTHRNFTGRADRLHINIVNGFSQQLGVQYGGFFLDAAMRWTGSVSVQYGRNRAVNAMSVDNRMLSVQTENNDFVHHFFNAYTDVTYRPAIKTRHSFGIGFVQEKVSDTVFALSPGFAPQARNMRYVNVYYRMSYADVDLMAYPTKGRITELAAQKKGFSRTISLWQLSAKNAVTWPVRNKYILNLRSVAMLKLPFDQPRMTKNFIGAEGLFLQGYEDYLIEGVAGAYVKASIARPIFGKTLYAPAKLLPSKLQRFRSVPLRLYARAFVNSGYVYDPQPWPGALSNRMLCSAGIGLDVVAFADWVLKLEWSVNLIGQNGLYLHPQNHF